MLSRLVRNNYILLNPEPNSAPGISDPEAGADQTWLGLRDPTNLIELGKSVERSVTNSLLCQNFFTLHMLRQQCCPD